jgi:hypothetical protein
MTRQAIADLPSQHRQIAKNRFKDIVTCALTLIKFDHFSQLDAVRATIAAIDFSNPDFYLDHKAIGANSPKRYVVDPLPR